MGVDPTSSAWKAEVLPLNYTRGAPDSGSAYWEPSTSSTAPSYGSGILLRSSSSIPGLVGSGILLRSSSSIPGLVLPRSYTRPHHTLCWWRGEDSNLRRLRRQIYSLIPLTAREPLRDASRSFSLISRVMSRVAADPHGCESGRGGLTYRRRLWLPASLYLVRPWTRRRASPGASNSAHRGGLPASRAPVARHSATPLEGEAT